MPKTTRTQHELTELIDRGSPELAPPAMDHPTDEAGRSAKLADERDDVPSDELGDFQEFFIPVHDFVRFNADELEIINHPAFQRLGKIYQLGQSHFVYRGATHKRIEHVLGTVWVAQKMCNAVNANYRRSLNVGRLTTSRCPVDDPLTIREIRFIRLAALLHDIGHLPAGHTLEDELGLLDAHDGDKRLKLVLSKSDWVSLKAATSLGQVIDNRYRGYLPKKELAPSPQEILRLLISKDATVPAAKVCDIRIGVCRDIVGNTICADLLDYLYRDWYHIGKPKYVDRRIFEYMEIRRSPIDKQGNFVISHGTRSRPKQDAISSILELLESRYNLAESVLFHPTKCSAAAMLERGIGELHDCVPVQDSDGWLLELETRALQFSDEELITDLLQEARKRKSDSATSLFSALAARNIYKSSIAEYNDAMKQAESGMILFKYLGVDQKASGERAKPSLQLRRNAAKLRLKMLQSLERDFDLQPGSVVMYCPGKSMNSKIAEVKVFHGNWIYTMHKWDQENGLAGGHCKAQLERFAKLWRIEMFLSESALAKLGAVGPSRDSQLLRQFRAAVKIAVFGISSPDKTPEEEMAEIADSLSKIEGSPYFGRTALTAMAARGDRENYPLGAPILQSLFQPHGSKS